MCGFDSVDMGVMNCLKRFGFCDLCPLAGPPQSKSVIRQSSNETQEYLFNENIEVSGVCADNYDDIDDN